MANKDFRVRDIAELYSFQKTGDVHGVATWSETSVSAHTTHSQNGTGSTSVSSTSYEKQRFFLREANGRETEVTLTDAEIAFRDGHHVTLIYCGHKAEKTGWVLCDLRFPSGEPVPFSPREILRRQLSAAAARGYRMTVGAELEFHVFRESGSGELEATTPGRQLLREESLDGLDGLG